MFIIKFLPARFGDAIWITYGRNQDLHHILIDGGTAGTHKDLRKELQNLQERDRIFDLVVVTHIDRDHIEGVLELLSEPKPDYVIKDIWFNGYQHLPCNEKEEYFGAVQGEKLTDRILQSKLPWNKKFQGKAIFVPDTGRLPAKRLSGGMKLTVLSPTLKGLSDLQPTWDEELRDNNLDPHHILEPNDTEISADEEETFGGVDLPNVDALADKEFISEITPANTSSIALMVEFCGKRVLLAGDADPDVLLSSLKRFSPTQSTRLDVFKISHHGSQYQTNKDLLQVVNCPVFVFSTNGSIYKHPDQEAVSRVIKMGGKKPQLVFNYRSSLNQIWETKDLQNKYLYVTCYPNSGEEGIEIDLS
jgi:beta-lactamase superfamily II metal-dependent hydrolase